MKTVTIDNLDFHVADSVADLILAISTERDELQEFAIWMTGCGYEFTKHSYFCDQRDKLLKNNNNDKTVEIND